jgi:hypothetical protein
MSLPYGAIVGVVGALAAVALLARRKPNLAKLAKRDPQRFLRALDAFRGLAPDDFAAVQGLLETQQLKPGAYLFKEGDKGSSLFIVAGGALKLTKELEGKRQVLKTANAGEVIGEMALLTGQPRTASAQAVGPTSVFKLDRTKFAEAKAKSHVLLEQIWRTYSWNSLDNYLRSAGEWPKRPSKEELQLWWQKQMPFSVDMSQKLVVPDGAGMLYAVTGRVSYNGVEANAPKLFSVSFESKLVATRSSRIIWLAPHPGFVAAEGA